MSGLSGAAPQVYGYFARLYGPTAAAGIVGNTQQESGNNAASGGGGLIQGQGGRTSSGSLAQQLAGVRRELEGPERGTLNALRGARGPREAARIFSQRFERPGIPMLSNRERYAQEALHRYGGLQGGPSFPAEGAPPGAPASQGAQQSPAQLGDLVGLLAQLQGGQGASTSVAGLSLPKPTAEPQTGPRVPRELPQAEPVAPSSLLSLLAKVGEDSPVSTTTLGREGGTGPPASVNAQGLVNPIPGFAIGRSDMGVDANAAPGTPIRAIGDAEILGISPDWYKGQPYVYYQLLNEKGEPHPTAARPHAGSIQYVAEQITPHVHAGQRVRAGQSIGVYAPSGTGIELGEGTSVGGRTKAQATTGYTEGQETPAGKSERRLLQLLGAR